MNIYQLVPKGKGDMETAAQLSQYPYNEIKPIVDELLMWIQDMHWPVASPVFYYLKSICEHLNDQIVRVLESNDEIWKFNCLRLFLGMSHKIIDERLLDEIKRIAVNPSKGEIAEDVHELAIELMEEVNKSLK
jgi:hypothetical protein